MNIKFYCPSCLSEEIYKTNQVAQSGRPRYRCRTCSHRTVNPATNPNNIWFSVPKTKISSHKRFVITSAQNDTPLNDKFFKSILNYCEEEDAKLLVIPVRYKNPDSFHVAIQDKISWPQEIIPYLCDSNLKINKNLTIMGNVKISATGTNPLSGLETISGTTSCIIGHAQLQMKPVATPKNKHTKILHSTGSISEKNYSRTKAGIKGSHHHSFAALVVEVEGDNFWIRQLMSDDTGGFYDLTKYYGPDFVDYDQQMEAIVYGDLHVRFLLDKIKNITFFAGNSIRNTLKPKYNIYHDVHDHSSGSHHTEQDHILKIFQTKNKQNDVRKELDETVKFLDEVGGGYIVKSNHHEHLYKWMNSYQKSDLINADIYYELMEMCRLEINKNSLPDPFKLYLEKYCSVPLEFIGGDDEYMIAGIDCSQHGDRGANGSRPSPNSFANVGNKMVVGHSHSPRIEKGFWQTGTSTVDLEYAKGLSSWLLCHCGIYPNGKRVLLTIVDNKWRPSWAV